MSCLLAYAALLGLVALECSNAFMLEYTDCVDLEKIRGIDVTRVCRSTLEPPSSNKRMVLIQPRTVTCLQGYECKIRESRFRYYCGAFSHPLSGMMYWCHRLVSGTLYTEAFPASRTTQLFSISPSTKPPLFKCRQLENYE